MAKIATWRDQYLPNPDIVYYMYEALLGSKLENKLCDGFSFLFPFGPTAELCSTILAQLKKCNKLFSAFFRIVLEIFHL